MDIQKTAKEFQERAEDREKERLAKLSTSKSKKNRLYAFIGIIALIIIGVFVYSMTGPGNFDSFAQCLSDKGAVMYGAETCTYSHAQRAMFGNSFSLINYKDFSGDQNVKITPTWLIDGQYLQGVQPFDKLSALTGCAIR